jgi:hypothetical protein
MACLGVRPRALQTEVSGMPVGTVRPRHAQGHYKPRLVACHGLPMACLGVRPRHARGHYYKQTEVSGMPWPAHGLPMACLGGCQGMPWPTLVGAMACLGGCHGMP